MSSYRLLEADRVVETLERLHARIEERFADVGLVKVCAETVDVARKTADRAAKIAQPNIPLRFSIAVLLIGGLAAQIWAARLIHITGIDTDVTSLIQGTEAAVNLLLLFGGAVWFLLTLEERRKRQRVLDALHELRSLAHIIDMHQLTKDPTIVMNPELRTKASLPARAMSQFELARYLDYCAEMLALIGKLAALYAERVRDPVVIESVTDVENLTANLGRKIWQKIMILSQLDESRSAH